MIIGSSMAFGNQRGEVHKNKKVVDIHRINILQSVYTDGNDNEGNEK